MTLLPPSTADEMSIYTGRVTNWTTVIASSLTTIVLLASTAMDGGSWWVISIPLGLAALVTILNVLTASDVRVSAGPNGVTVHWGLFGWPRGHYPLTLIQQAKVINLPWYSAVWGFWWTPRRTFSTVHGGRTLRLVLNNGRTVTITVPDPAAAVAALEESKAAQSD